jgi:hypothetical protein
MAILKLGQKQVGQFMRVKLLTLLNISLLTCTQALAGPIYCPQKSGYIDVGMTEDQVISACGQPLTKQAPNVLVTQKVPVKQLIYTNLNTGSVYPGLNPAFYNQWSLPSGSTGIGLEVDIMNNKVSAVRINGSGTNAMSVCGGVSVQVGDDVGQVYSACGSPSMVNNTFVNQPIPSNSKPQVWIYQVDQYQAPISLTFVNGKLQSIE